MSHALEVAVLSLLEEGLNGVEVAEKLDISPQLVSYYKNSESILRKKKARYGCDRRNGFCPWCNRPVLSPNVFCPDCQEKDSRMKRKNYWKGKHIQYEKEAM